ncbi:uncharacterized protein LOC115708945 [Cannabis sativa]|uniref:uncharacterized protein LOC115708945 n=1 Tax=Cannabis sativa TaxID=3483 RepID=UPI0029C9D92B|nr:uncharacterized protein LOC115708945 [Cannabis sativa]
MSLLSWNARGLGSSRAFHNFSLLCKQHQPQIFFVMETKLAAHSTFVSKAKIRFTWKHGTSLERLDWAIVNHKWNTLFPTASLHHLSFFGSDHRAIKVVFDGNPMIFRDKNKFKGEIKRIQSEIDNILTGPFISPSDVQTANTLQHSLDNLLLKEEVFWKQRSRANWLKASDKNTKYFHSRASTRKRNNFIKSLTLNDNSSVSSLHDITNSFVQFYSNLFTIRGTDADAIALILQGINKTITPNHHDFLDSQFDFAEVKRALFQLPGDKAPGPDGLNPSFYQKNWNIVCIDLCNDALHVLNTNADIAQVNETILVLIPKVKNACRIKDFWPISLCSTIYKVVSKAIANRLKSILCDLISHNQGAFLSDRIIFDNIIIANEVIHAITNRKTGKVGWASLKLDKEKAFDKVEWDFIRYILHHFGFPSHFILSFFGVFLQSPPPISHLLFDDDSLLFTRVSDSSCTEIKDILLIYQKAVSLNVFHAPKNHPSFFSFKKPVPNYLCGTKTFSLKLWGSIGNKQRIHWISWDHLFKSKFFGGLGFCNLVHHNQAVLAKQAWRIFTSPNSLVAWLLKAKYFNKIIFSMMQLATLLPSVGIVFFGVGSFSLRASSGRSGMELLLESLTPNGFLTGIAFLSKLVYLPLYPFIPINPSNSDCLIWKHHPSGCFTVNSAYHLANSHSSAPSSSNPVALKSWWTSVWSSNIPPKIKHFVWKAFNHLLPSNLNLFHHKSMFSPSCSICSTHLDSNTHSLITCSRAGKFWKNYSFSNFYFTNNKCDIKEFLLRGFEHFDKDNFTLFLGSVWAIWNRRNKAIFTNHNYTDLDVEASVLNYLQEYRDAQLKINTPSSLTQSSSTNLQPPSGMFQLNVDVALFSSSNNHGYGAIVTDSTGQVIAGFLASSSSGLSPISPKQKLYNVLCFGVRQFVFLSALLSPTARIWFSGFRKIPLTVRLFQDILQVLFPLCHFFQVPQSTIFPERITLSVTIWLGLLLEQMKRLFGTTCVPHLEDLL